MTNEEMLHMLKYDLQMRTEANDEYLNQLIEYSKKAIEREGIKLSNDLECSMIIVQYAAYLFRKRGSNDSQMPRFLRYSLNNLLLSQKGQIDDNL